MTAIVETLGGRFEFEPFMAAHAAGMAAAQAE
jgi:hypothetical protein